MSCEMLEKTFQNFFRQDEQNLHDNMLTQNLQQKSKLNNMTYIPTCSDVNFKFKINAVS